MYICAEYIDKQISKNMKKLLLMLALLMGFVMVGCTEDTPDTTPDPIFETNVEQNFVVYEEGANIEVEVRTNLEYSVVIPANVTWVTHVETRALRNETLVFSVAPYDGSSSRGTTISLVGADGAMLQSIVIVQSVRAIELIAENTQHNSQEQSQAKQASRGIKR